MQIASVLDMPSVYMGGPSHANQKRAEKVIELLEEQKEELIKALGAQ